MLVLPKTIGPEPPLQIGADDREPFDLKDFQALKSPSGQPECKDLNDPQEPKAPKITQELQELFALLVKEGVVNQGQVEIITKVLALPPSP
jgi:hypothetical protein